MRDVALDADLLQVLDTVPSPVDQEYRPTISATNMLYLPAQVHRGVRIFPPMIMVFTAR